MRSNNLFNPAVMIAVVVAACQTVTQPSAIVSLKPGDQVDGMILTTGASDAPPLWAFCSSPQERNHATRVDCRVPQLPNLAIGHTFGVANEALQESDWSAAELYLDDIPMDLDAFGTYNFTLPTIANSPSRVREVFRRFTAWNIVLTELKPGKHTLRGLVRTQVNTFTWLINLTIFAQRTGQ